MMMMMMMMLSYLSPLLTLCHCLPMMQVKVGPSNPPGIGFSDTPADHSSRSSGVA